MIFGGLFGLDGIIYKHTGYAAAGESIIAATNSAFMLSTATVDVEQWRRGMTRTRQQHPGDRSLVFIHHVEGVRSGELIRGGAEGAMRRLPGPHGPTSSSVGASGVTRGGAAPCEGAGPRLR